jgi:AcrR family transcriptional regulator
MNKKDEVKEKIGKGAMRCFAQFGLDKTTLDDIAKTVGLNKTSLYYYYKSKEDIFIEVAIKEGYDFIMSLQKEALKKKGIEDQVLFYMTARFNYYKNVVNMSRVSVNTLNKILPKFFELYDEMMKQEKEFLSQLIQKAVKEQEIILTNEDKIASILINVSDALKHSVEQQAILKMENTINYTQSLSDMKFLVSLIFNGLKKKDTA